MPIFQDEYNLVNNFQSVVIKAINGDLF